MLGLSRLKPLPYEALTVLLELIGRCPNRPHLWHPLKDSGCDFNFVCAVNAVRLRA